MNVFIFQQVKKADTFVAVLKNMDSSVSAGYIKDGS